MQGGGPGSGRYPKGSGNETVADRTGEPTWKGPLREGKPYVGPEEVAPNVTDKTIMGLLDPETDDSSCWIRPDGKLEVGFTNDMEHTNIARADMGYESRVDAMVDGAIRTRVLRQTDRGEGNKADTELDLEYFDGHAQARANAMKILQEVGHLFDKVVVTARMGNKRDKPPYKPGPDSYNFKGPSEGAMQWLNKLQNQKSLAKAA